MPAQDPPPVPDAATLSGAVVKRPSIRPRVFWIYLACGGVLGLPLGQLLIPIHFGSLCLEHCIWAGDISEFRIPPGEPFKMSLAAAICVPIYCAFLSGFLFLFACVWPRLRHPASAASFCASPGGIIYLPMLVRYQLERDGSLIKFWGDLAMLAGIMALGAAFGVAHAMVTRRVVGWLDKQDE